MGVYPGSVLLVESKDFMCYNNVKAKWTAERDRNR